METHQQTRSKHLGSYLRDGITHSLIAVVRTYQFLLSPWVGHHCRFTPTCSHYAIEALQTHGPLKGSGLTACRLCKCHPWHTGGFDPVPNISHPTKKTVYK